MSHCIQIQRILIITPGKLVIKYYQMLVWLFILPDNAVCYRNILLKILCKHYSLLFDPLI